MNKLLNIGEMNREELSALAFHEISVSKLLEYCDPFKGCWMELDQPITKEEVLECIKNGDQELTDTPIWTAYALGSTKLSLDEARLNHIKKIAYFATNEIQNPITIDVGIPDMNCFVSHFVDDGNHRFAGAIVAGKESIKSHVCGSIDYAKELGLHNPNEYEIALCEMDDREYAKKKKRKNSP